jgi:hypothetical protein
MFPKILPSPRCCIMMRNSADIISEGGDSMFPKILPSPRSRRAEATGTSPVPQAPRFLSAVVFLWTEWLGDWKGGYPWDFCCCLWLVCFLV